MCGCGKRPLYGAGVQCPLEAEARAETEGSLPALTAVLTRGRRDGSPTRGEFDIWHTEGRTVVTVPIPSQL